MRTQKELKEFYKELVLEQYGTGSWEKFLLQRCGYIVELHNGKLIILEKPTIQTTFCFGYGWCGRSTDEEENITHELWLKATTDPSYFLEQNIGKIKDKIVELENVLLHPNRNVVVVGEESEEPFAFYDVQKQWDEIPKGRNRIGEDDINRILDGLEEIKAAFEKRLHTYLKRYGLSKINAWTYLRD